MYLHAMKSYLIDRDRGGPGFEWKGARKVSSEEYSQRILACCYAAKIDWC